MRFCDIPGHEEAKTRLRDLADGGRIPHAILLEGPDGIGKFAMARAFLQYVECERPVDGDSCGECPSCVQHKSMQHIDTMYSFPVIKKKNKTSETISDDYLPEFIEFVAQNPFMDRDLWIEKIGAENTSPVIYADEASHLVRKLNYAAHSARYKAVIIWQADKLNETASNKLLKLIEEPPGQAIIIMTTSQPMNILPTIYSRTQRIKMSRHPEMVIEKWLLSEGIAQPGNANMIAALSEGSLTRATRLSANNDDSVQFLDSFISLMRLAYQRNIAALKDWSQTMGNKKRETVIGFLEYMSRMLRENFVANFKDEDLNQMLPSEWDFSRNFSRFVNERNVLWLYEAVNEALEDVKANGNTKIILFDLAITVILRLKD